MYVLYDYGMFLLLLLFTGFGGIWIYVWLQSVDKDIEAFKKASYGIVTGKEYPSAETPQSYSPRISKR